MTSLNVGKRKNKDYYCGLIFSELIEGPLTETDLLTRLLQQDVLAVEVRPCLVLMEENGSICQSKTAAGGKVWKLPPELHRGDFSEDTAPSESSLNELYAGIETTSLESSTSEDTVPKSSLSIEINLRKIISVFDKQYMNLKPKDVAQKSGIGKTSKSVNKLLYLLAKKKVLTVTFSNGKDPKWNKDPSAQYSDRDLHEWAAELEYGITRFPAPPLYTRWAELITDEVAEECYKYFDNYIETNFDKTKDEYGHLKDILHVLKERGQLSSRLNSANRFLYVFYKFDKDKDTSFLNPPPEPPKKEELKDGVKEEPMTPAVPLEKLDMHLKSLRPEDVGNFIGKKGIHIRRLLKEKQGSKIIMGKEEGHVKIEIEATKEDLQEIKDRLLQREALVNHGRRQHEESVRQYNEMMGEPSSMDYQSAEESMDQ